MPTRPLPVSEPGSGLPAAADDASPSVRDGRTGPTGARRDATLGAWLGLVGVVIFAMTLPMTRLAVGPASDPQLAPGFVTAGRAAVAGVCALVALLAFGTPTPRRGLWRPLGVSALGTVVGFPLFLSLALRRVDASHAAVISGLMPIATAVAASIRFRQRPSVAFWACAAAGCILVLGYAAWRSGGAPTPADALLLLAVASTAFGYVGGAEAAAELPGEQVICWVLVASLPATLPVALALAPLDRFASIRPAAWLGFGYVSLFSMWIGFFAWYRGLALGGTVRVSQIQLLQPFLALLFAVPVLGESLDPVAAFFALAIIAVVFLGRRTAVRAIVAVAPPVPTAASAPAFPPAPPLP